MATQVATSVPSKRLQVSILSTDLAFVSNNILSWAGLVDGVTNLTTMDFGARAFGCFRNPTNTQIEFFEWDPTTVANASITIISRGLGYNGGTVANAAPAYNWNSNETIVELGGTVPQLFEQYVDKTSDETIGGLKTFTTLPQSSASPSSSTDFATKAYVDATATGSAIYDQNIIAGIAGETLAAGKVVYFKTSDQRWYLADQGTAATCVGVQLGFAQGTATAGNAVNILLAGVEKNQSSLSAGGNYYLGSSGAVASSAGSTTEVFVGRAKSSTVLIVDFRGKELLGNDTTVKLGAGNKMVTQSGLQHAAEQYSLDSSVSANTITITPSPVLTAYTTGLVLHVKVANAVTGATTINANSLGAKTVKKYSGAALADLAANDLLSGQLMTVIYDGTYMILQSPSANVASGGLAAKTGNTTHDMSSTTSTVIAHGLGKTPTLVRIMVNLLTTSVSASPAVLSSFGTYDGTTQNCIYVAVDTNGGPSALSSIDTTHIIHFGKSGGGTADAAGLKGTISVDGTNITIAWATFGGGTVGTGNIIWEALA